MRNLFKNGSISFIALFILAGFFILQFGCSSDSPVEQTKKGPQVELSPEDELYFGQIPQGQTATREFLIYNTGDEPLVVSEMKIEGSDASSFALEGVSGEITIPINKIQSFPVRFDPIEVRSFDAQVTVTSNAKTSPDAQLLTGTAISSAGNITFERIIGRFGSDVGGTVDVLDDGGFIIAGSSYNKDDDENLATLFRLDQYGNLLWNKQYPVAGIASFSGLVVTASGNFVCTGSTRTGSASQNDVFALSTDDAGNFLWQEVYDLGGTQRDDGNDIIKTTHGGFLICGTTYNTADATGGVKDALLLKIDNNGTYEWHKVYGTTEGEEAHSVKQTKNGGYVFTGSTTVPPIPSDKPGGDFDFLLVKTDGDGNQLWLKTFGGTENYDFGSSIVIDELGGYMMAGYTASFGAGAKDYWLIKTDTSGVEEWNKTYGGQENDIVSEIIQTNDNGFYIVGTSASFTVGENVQPTNQIWIIKTDNSGNEEWDELYGGEGGESGSSACELDGGYIISGSTSSYGIGNEVYVLRTNDDGSI
jgi:hypothetical protein